MQAPPERRGLEKVDVATKPVDGYSEAVGREVMEELRETAVPLRSARVAHINATSYGGGVSELLRSLVPLCRALDIEAEWLVIPGSPEFFQVTKGIHNGLQGAPYELTSAARATYLEHSEVVARTLEREYDYIIVHDPQPAALRSLHGPNDARWVWRCHIDTSEPDAEVLSFLTPFLDDYDALVFTMDEFVPKGLREKRLFTIPPGIDPLSPKNLAGPSDMFHRIIQWAGVDHDQPLITQVSRFDPWKDPLGVIEVYRRVKEQVPRVQLALLGQMALDDPEGWEMYHEIAQQAWDDPDLHVLTNFTGVGNIEVNAFQSCSNLVLQKSLREGFGLVVSETLWKGTPVVAGRAGGLPMQMPKGTGGYLVDSIEDCVEKTVRLLRDPIEAQELGAKGRAHVRERFLITRLLRDELRLLQAIG